MDLFAALRKRLVDDAAVSALVDDRVYWSQRKQGEDTPALVLTLVSETWDDHLKGRSGPYEVRIQVDAFAENAAGKGGHATAWQLAYAARDALIPAAVIDGFTFARATPDTARDLSEKTETTFINRVSIDLIVRHYGDVQ